MYTGRHAACAVGVGLPVPAHDRPCWRVICTTSQRTWRSEEPSAWLKILNECVRRGSPRSPPPCLSIHLPLHAGASASKCTSRPDLSSLLTARSLLHTGPEAGKEQKSSSGSRRRPAATLAERCCMRRRVADVRRMQSRVKERWHSCDLGRGPSWRIMSQGSVEPAKR